MPVELACSQFCFLVSKQTEILLLPAHSLSVSCSEELIHFRKTAIRL
jgi:hypothetical protein